MALLKEIKERTASIIRKFVPNKTILLWSNEALEQLSEIAKVEVDPIVPKLNNGVYDYLILTDGTHLFRYVVSEFETETVIYYDMEYNEVTKTVTEADIVSSQEQTIGTIFYNLLIMTDTFDTTMENIAPKIDNTSWFVL